MCNRCFSVGFGGVENICCSTICHDWVISIEICVVEGVHTLPVHWHVQISNLTIRAKYFSKVIFSDIFCKFLDHDLTELALGSFKELRANLCASDWTGGSATADAATCTSVSTISSRGPAWGARGNCATRSGGGSRYSIGSLIRVWRSCTRATSRRRS
jgi:hypothetical protein